MPERKVTPKATKKQTAKKATPKRASGSKAKTQNRDTKGFKLG